MAVCVIYSMAYPSNVYLKLGTSYINDYFVSLLLYLCYNHLKALSLDYHWFWTLFANILHNYINYKLTMVSLRCHFLFVLLSLFNYVGVQCLAQHYVSSVSD